MDSQTEQPLPQAEAIRFCFRFNPQDIPGPPGARSITIADAFMQRNFNRKFDWEKHHVYTPAGIDDEVSTRKLFLFLDVNKHANPTFQSLRCYLVVKGNPLTFTETTFNAVRNFSDMFPWGGRDWQLAKDTEEVQGTDQGVEK